jgi:lysozyme
MASQLILDPGQVLKKGSQGDKVNQLQEILQTLGLNPGTIDGSFGDKTVAAVKQFQQQKHLDADGIVGKGTQNALNNALGNISENAASVAGYGGSSGKLPLCGVALIKEFEGFFSQAYPDPLTKAKPYTIGWGTTRKRDGSEWSLGETITREEGDQLLIFQLDHDYLPTIAKIPGWDQLNAHQQGALLSFGYNLGASFYGNPDFQSITNVLKNRQWDKITETFVKYRNPGSNVEAGLKRRREAEAKLFLTPMS